MCLTAVDLQVLINICFEFSRKRRFNFGINKTNCMVSNKNLFLECPSWDFGGRTITNTDTFDIIGNVFSSNMPCDSNMEKRVNTSHLTMYALASVGCENTGLATDVKVHMWKTIGLPSFLYNLEIFTNNRSQQKHVESVQAAIIKRIVGFPKRSHHSEVLKAVVDDVMSSVFRNTLSLRGDFFKDSPARALEIQIMKEFFRGKCFIPGTVLHRVISVGYSQIKSLFIKKVYSNPVSNFPHDGVVDRRRFLICNKKFIKPYSEEHILATLLTGAF